MIFDGWRSIFVPGHDIIVSNPWAILRVPVSAAVMLAGVLLSADAMSATPAYRLNPLIKLDQVLRTRAILEVSGELKLNSDGKKVTRLPLRVKGEFVYDERTLETDPASGQRRDVRLYQQATADIHVGEHLRRTELRSDCRLAVSETTQEGILVFSPLAPMTRDELELVDVPGSTSVLSRLLPDQEVKIGDRWSHDRAVLAALLGLDVVTQTDVSSTLRQVEGAVARMTLKGSISGAVRGISSDVDIEANYDFDLDQRRITWLAMSTKEIRSIGHAEPGFEATARLQLATAPGPPCPELADAALESLPLQSSPGTLLLRFESSPGGFQFLHDRTWRVMLDRHDVTIMRRVEKGDLVAQLNASKLPDLTAGQQVQLEAFQTDVQRSLGDSFVQFVEASQSTSDQGLRVLRAVVSGIMSELPIQWTFYHLSDGKGQQIALVFTMDGRLVERFAEADRILVGSLAFAAAPQASNGQTQ